MRLDDIDNDSDLGNGNVKRERKHTKTEGQR